MQVSMQIALLERRSISELQEIWKKYFDAPPTTYNKEFYISRIAHRISERGWQELEAAIPSQPNEKIKVKKQPKFLQMQPTKVDDPWL